MSRNPLLEALTFRGKERDIFEKLITMREPKRAKELEELFGERVYHVLRKMKEAGMIEKTDEGYVLSPKFSRKLRRWAEEWEILVQEGKWEVEGYEIV